MKTLTSEEEKDILHALGFAQALLSESSGYMRARTTKRDQRHIENGREAVRKARAILDKDYRHVPTG